MSRSPTSAHSIRTRRRRSSRAAIRWANWPKSARTTRRQRGLRDGPQDEGGIEMHGRPLSSVALLGIGLAGVVAVSAAASTLAARPAANPIELVLHARHEPFPNPPFTTVRHVGT